MKKISLEKQEIFVEQFVNTGNATQSAIAIGYKDSSAKQMGRYLKKKLALEIEQQQKEILLNMNNKSLNVLESLLQAESESVRLNACKLVLECNGYSKSTDINVKMNDPDSSKSDEELIAEFKSLIGTIPHDEKEVERLEKQFRLDQSN